MTEVTMASTRSKISILNFLVSVLLINSSSYAQVIYNRFQPPLLKEIGKENSVLTRLHSEDMINNPRLLESFLKSKLHYNPTGKLITEIPSEIKNLPAGRLDPETLASFQLFFDREGFQKQSRTPIYLNSSMNTPFVGTDIPISANSTFAPAPNTQEKPAIASNGDIYLVVWHDWRNQYRGTFSDADIYATRIDANGNILDPQGILVCNASSNQLVPAVTSDGKDFLVIWLDARNYTTWDKWDIYGAKITTEGTVLDANGFLIEDKPNTLASAEYPPLGIVHSDSNYMIVWEQEDRVILGHVLDKDGHPIFSNPISMPENLAIGSGNQYHYPAIASNGKIFFVAWCENKPNNHAVIRATRVSTNGVIIDGVGMTLVNRSTSYNYLPKNTAISFLGDTLLVTFNNSTNSEVHGIRVSNNGKLIDSESFLIIDAGPQAGTISVTSQSNHWLVATPNRVGYDYLVSAALVKKDRSVSGPIHLFPSSPGVSTRNWEAPAVCSNNHGFLMAWDGNAISQNGIGVDVLGARLSSDGKVEDVDYQTLSLAPAEQLYPSIAFDGTNYLAVWQDSRNARINENGYDIYGARITQTGTVLDLDGIPICTAPRHQLEPKIAFDGMNFFVVWEDRRELPSMGYTPLKRIYGTFVSKDGNVLNSNSIPLIPSDLRQDLYQVNPDVAFGQDSYCVVWQNGDTWLPHGVGDIFAIRFSTNGALIDNSSIGITAAGQMNGLTHDAEYPDIAFNGEEFLVTWCDYRSATVSPISDAKDIYAARVGLDGKLKDSLRGFKVSREKKLCTFPQTATDGQNWLITWDQCTYAGYDFLPFDVFGTLLDREGVPHTNSDIPISNLVSNEEYPAVVFNGHNYIVTWTDDRNNSWDIYAARIDTDATLVDKDGFLVSNASGIQIIPMIAAMDSNTLISWIDDRSFYQTGSDIYGSVIKVPLPELLQILTTVLANGKVEENYADTLKVAGGIAPFSWEIISGELPDNLYLIDSKGIIQGIPTQSGEFNFILRVFDSQIPSMADTGHFSISIVPADFKTITIRLEEGTIRTPYSDTLKATGGVPPYYWEILEGGFPENIVLQHESGIIEGIPNYYGDYPVTISVTDSYETPHRDTLKLALIIHPAHQTNKKVFAHYLGWYADSTYSINPRRHWNLGYAHKPLIGEYHSQHPSLIIYHTLLAWASGIDGFIHDWYGTIRPEISYPNCTVFEDSSLVRAFDLTKQLNQNHANLNFKLCICYDQNLELKMNKQRIDQIKHIWENYVKPEIGTTDTTYLWTWNEKIQQKSPVLFYYTNAETDFEQFRNDIDSALPDSLCWFLVPKELPIVPKKQLRFVDSAYPWVQVDSSNSTNWRGPGNYIDWFYRTAVDLDTNQFVMGGVWPGFDDRHITDPSWLKKGYMSRLKGATYDSTWYLINHFNTLYSEYSYMDARWIQIETWNDWNEGTEIEPSEEYGYQYLISSIENIETFKDTIIGAEDLKFVAAESIYVAARLIEKEERDSLQYYPIFLEALKYYLIADFDTALMLANQIIKTGIHGDKIDLPIEFMLHQNYPNPFNPSTTINFALPRESEVLLKIFNIKGGLVCTLVERKLPRGSHSVIWNGQDLRGKQCPSGIYFCRLKAGDFTSMKKLTLLK